jgi:aspartyl-tRNA(Asn)/glutamyl-tRNA(Gln) amidotransferase subunit A
LKSLFYKTARELVNLIRSKKLSPVELMEKTLQRIEAVNPVLNAFVSVRAEQAMDEAKMLAERLASNEAIGPLGGIPIGVRQPVPLLWEKPILLNLGSPVLQKICSMV